MAQATPPPTHPHPYLPPHTPPPPPPPPHHVHPSPSSQQAELRPPGCRPTQWPPRASARAASALSWGSAGRSAVPGHAPSRCPGDPTCTGRQTPAQDSEASKPVDELRRCLLRGGCMQCSVTGPAADADEQCQTPAQGQQQAGHREAERRHQSTSSPPPPTRSDEGGKPPIILHPPTHTDEGGKPPATLLHPPTHTDEGDGRKPPEQGVACLGTGGDVGLEVARV